MGLAVAIALMLSSSHVLFVQQTNDPLGTELFKQYKAWFAAMDRGDGAAMDAIEVDDLIVLAPNGALCEKHGPRAGNQPVQQIVPDRTWTDGVLRRFQDTAILTGRITNKTPKTDVGREHRRGFRDARRQMAHRIAAVDASSV